jgi:hypothetical protein
MKKQRMLSILILALFSTGILAAQSTYFLRIEANVRGATIFIDGRQQRDQTPAAIRVSRGRHEVIVQADGYDDYRAMVNVTRDTVLRINLERAVYYDLNLLPNIAQAEVYINGERRGAGSFSLRLKAGNYEIRIVAPGYEDYETSVTLNNNRRLNAELTPKFVNVRFDLPVQFIAADVKNPWDSIQIELDGIPVQGPVIRVFPGTHIISLQSGIFRIEQQFAFQIGRNYVIRPTLDFDID